MIIDLLVSIFLIWGVLTGFSSGLIKYLCSSLAFFVGIIGALYWMHAVGVYLNRLFNLHSEYIPFVAFFVAFIGILLLMRLLAGFLDRTVRLLYLNLYNRLAGAVLGACFFAFLASLFLWLFDQMTLLDPGLKVRSHTHDYIAPVFPLVVALWSEYVPLTGNLLDNLHEMFDQLVHLENTSTTHDTTD